MPSWGFFRARLCARTPRDKGLCFRPPQLTSSQFTPFRRLGQPPTVPAQSASHHPRLPLSYDFLRYRPALQIVVRNRLHLTGWTIVCVPSHSPLLPISIEWFVGPSGRTQMPRSTFNSQHPHKWADVLRREMQMTIGQQLRDEYELLQELPSEPSARLIRKDKEHDPYADIVGTC